MRNASTVLPGLLLPAPSPRAPSSNHFFYSLASVVFSHKFGKKVTYFNDLSELHERLKYDQLTIPPEVLQ